MGSRRLLIGLCAAAAATALPGAALWAEIRLTPSVSVTETFSDNIDLDPDGEEESALQTDLTPALQIRSESARFTTNINAAFTARHQTAGEDQGVVLLPELTGVSTIEVSNDLLFINTASTVSQELLNSRQGNTEANRDTVQNYQISPYVVGRLGGFADTEVRYTLDQIITGGGDGGDGEANDSTSNSVSLAVTSGDDFAELLWAFTASASNRTRSNDDDVERRDVTLDAEYVVDRSFSVLASAGYQKLDDGDEANKINAPTWSGGFRWRPGTRTELTVTYGMRDDSDNLFADFSYEIGPRTTLTAGFTDQLTTGDERISQNLSFIGLDPDTGDLIDTRTGLPFDATTGPTSLVNDIQRTKTFTLALLGTRGRNSLQVSGSVQKQTDEGGADGQDEETGYTLSVGFARQLSRRTDLNLAGTFDRNEFEDEDRTDNEFGFTSSLTYVVFRNISAFTSYTLRRQTSTDEENDFVENAITAGLQMTF